MRFNKVQSRFLCNFVGALFAIGVIAACNNVQDSPGNIAKEEVTKPVYTFTPELPTATVSIKEFSDPTATSVRSSETAAPSATPEPSLTPSWVGPDTYPEAVNPITGIMMEDPEKLERRPVMIKVSNYPASMRPHTGLSFADLVFSYYIGEGMTRYLALYHGQDAAQVGPVRSGRLIDSQLVGLYGGFLGMVGADQSVWADIAAALPGRFLTEMPVNCPAICDNGYGTAFANTEAFTARVRELGLDDQRPDLSGLMFDENVTHVGQEVSKLWLYISYYNQVGWDYQSDTGRYLRSQETTQADGTVLLEPMTDRATGEQLAFDNVVIIFAWHNIIKPELIGIELQSVVDGRAILLRNGLGFEITYTATSPTSPLRFFDSEGNPMAFKPGTTWFEIVGLGTTVEELESGSWKIRFYP